LSETLAKTVSFRSAGFAELVDPVNLARLVRRGWLNHTRHGPVDLRGSHGGK
jgi:hypothetical protein